ncbi:MAG TPA: mechanosensitive ion channel domain-containing protein [Flavobacterium sp.]
MKKLPFCIIVLFFVFHSNETLAQKENTSTKSDSLNSSILNELYSKKAESDKKRTTDSIKTATLQSQLQKLKTTENLKKEELLKQLQELKEEDAKRLKEKKAQIDALRKTAKAYPVHGFFKDTLFFIYDKLGSFSAHDRALSLENKIKALGSNFFFKIDSLKIVNTENSSEILNGENIITSITENDAIWNNTSKQELAKKYKNIISISITKYKEETSLTRLAKEIGLASIVLLILVSIIYYLNKLSLWLAKKIEEQENKIINGIKIKSYVLFDAKKQVSTILVLNKIFKWVFILLAIYIALPILFGIFPWTKDFSTTLFGYILNPLKKITLAVWNYMPNLITIIVVIIVFRYFIKAIHFFKEEIEKGKLKINGFYTDWANPTYQIIRLMVLAFMLVVIFPYLPGSDSPVFQGVSVFLGVLFTFGSSGPLSNIIAGLVLTYMRLFKIGDRVKIGDVVGDIIEKSLLVTRIRTIKNEIISIPNTTVMGSHTINYSSDTREKGLILHTTVTIGYDVPWKDMYQALLNAADRTNLILKNPKPFVLQTSLDDFYVAYQINGYTKEANKQANIYSELHSNIQDCCSEMGIEIMSPHYRAGRDGNKTTIPKNYLNKD